MGAHVGREMAVAINPAEPCCRTFEGISISVRPEGFNFMLGYADRPSGTAWRMTVASTREGESFIDTFMRARDIHDVIVLGEDKPCDLGDVVDFGLVALDERVAWLEAQLDSLTLDTRAA